MHDIIENGIGQLGIDPLFNVVTNGKGHDAIEALPNQTCLFAAFGREKVVRPCLGLICIYTQYIQKYPWKIQEYLLNCRSLNDIYIELQNSMIRRSLEANSNITPESVGEAALSSATLRSYYKKKESKGEVYIEEARPHSKKGLELQEVVRKHFEMVKEMVAEVENSLEMEQLDDNCVVSIADVIKQGRNKITGKDEDDTSSYMHRYVTYLKKVKAGSREIEDSFISSFQKPFLEAFSRYKGTWKGGRSRDQYIKWISGENLTKEFAKFIIEFEIENAKHAQCCFASYEDEVHEKIVTAEAVKAKAVRHANTFSDLEQRATEWKKSQLIAELFKQQPASSRNSGRKRSRTDKVTDNALNDATKLAEKRLKSSDKEEVINEYLQQTGEKKQNESMVVESDDNDSDSESESNF